MRLLRTHRFTPDGWIPVRRRRSWPIPELAAFIGAAWIALTVILPLTIECIELEGRIAVQQRQGETQR
jgi:hypothetical protein